MKLLLDEAVSPRLATVLTALGHPSEHVRALGIRGASDQEVVDRARSYDALVTLDLHRQGPEWIAVNEAMLTSAKIIRLRFGQAEDNGLMGQARSLIMKWSEIERAVLHEPGIRLVTVSRAGSSVRTLTSDEIEELLQARRT